MSGLSRHSLILFSAGWPVAMRFHCMERMKGPQRAETMEMKLRLLWIGVLSIGVLRDGLFLTLHCFE